VQIVVAPVDYTENVRVFNYELSEHVGH
jgi:hypothetical protein